MKHIPDNFDFSNSQINGLLRKYRFVDRISEGSQGEILRYRSEDGFEVVYKFYRPSDISTQMGEDALDPYHQNMEEFNALSYLSTVARISTYELYHGIPDEYDDPLQATFKAAGYNDHQKIRSNPMTVFPITIDSAMSIEDLATGGKFRPYSKPPRQQRLMEKLGSFSHVIRAPLYSYESGTTLDEVLADDNLERREKAAKELIKAVAIIHALGIMHRDIKPFNVLLTASGVKLLDFGISERFWPSDRIALAAGLTRSKPYHERRRGCQTEGSRILACPQSYQREPRNTDDMWSTGLLAGILLTGKHPYLEEPFREFRNYMSASRDERKHVKRKYSELCKKSLKDGKILDLFQAKHDEFCRAHPEVHPAITRMIHPRNKKRFRRMITPASMMGIKYPHIIKNYEAYEFTATGFISGKSAKAQERLDYPDRIIAYYFQEEYIDAEISRRLKEFWGQRR